jgi:hypothetical protein
MVSEIDLLKEDIPRLEKSFGVNNSFVKVLKAQLASLLPSFYLRREPYLLVVNKKAGLRGVYWSHSVVRLSRYSGLSCRCFYFLTIDRAFFFLSFSNNGLQLKHKMKSISTE